MKDDPIRRSRKIRRPGDGRSEWVKIDQDRVNKFADATGDHQWIHVDIERAKRELPTKGTIAHGYLTLSLDPDAGRANHAHRRRQPRHQLRLEQGALHQHGAGRRARARQAQKLLAVDAKGPGMQINNESRSKSKAKTARPASPRRSGWCIRERPMRPGLLIDALRAPGFPFGVMVGVGRPPTT